MLAYLSISCAALPGQPRPLNHPRFTGSDRRRVDAVLGGAATAMTKFEASLAAPEGPSALSERQRAEQLQRMRAKG